MSQPKLNRTLLWILASIAVTLISLLVGIRLWPTQSDPVTSAWEAVRRAGSYHFSSDVTQLTLPTATLGNVSSG